MWTLKDNLLPVSLGILTAFALMVMFYFMKPVLVPFVFAVFLYFLVSPILDWFQCRLKLPRLLALILTFIGLLAFFGFFITVLGISLTGFISSSDIYQAKLLSLVDEISGIMLRFGVNIDLTIFKKYFSELPLLDYVTEFSGGVVTIIGNILLVLIFTFFLVIGESSEKKDGFLNTAVQHKISKYIMVKCFTSALTAISVWIVFTIFGLQLASTFAVLTFFLNFIPNLGSIIASLLPLPIAYLQFGPTIVMVLVIAIPAVIQFGIGNILDPKLMGENLGLHPVVVLLALLFWGFLWGIPGMFLSVPITAVLKILLERSEFTLPLAKILAGQLKYR